MGTSDMKYILGNNAKDLMKNFNANSDKVIETYWDSIKEMAQNFTSTLSNMFSLSGLKKSFEDGTLGDGVVKFLKDGISAAIYRHRWPLKSSLALTTGQNVTPWHVTVGHPLNPVISMGNVIIENSSIDFSNELGYNDMPIKINVSGNIRQGRPMGKNELIEILNNSYERVYSTGESIFEKPDKIERISSKKVTSIPTNTEIPTLPSRNDSQLSSSNQNPFDSGELLEGGENLDNPFNGG
jgi:hypothetical protein